MKSLTEQLTGKCRHFRAPHHNKTCKVGCVYDEVAKVKELGFEGSGLRKPCTGDPVGSETRGHEVQPCDKYSALTETETTERIEEIENHSRLLSADLSVCCEAPIDHRHAITEGEHKGHGPRYCSKCKKLAYMV